MKTLIFAICILFLTVPCMAADVSLAWDASVSSGVTGYKVYVGGASRAYGAPITIGNQTTYTVTGLGPGTYFFAVSAFDVDGNESDYSNEVSQAIYSPLIITVTPAQLAAMAGKPFTATFTAQGGAGQYAYQVVGTLPAGIALNIGTGILAGTPLQAGNFTFTVKVTDAANQTATIAVTMKVSLAAPTGLSVK